MIDDGENQIITNKPLSIRSKTIWKSNVFNFSTQSKYVK